MNEREGGRERERERERKRSLVHFGPLGCPPSTSPTFALSPIIVCVLDLDKGGFLLSTTPPPTCKEEDDQW